MRIVTGYDADGHKVYRDEGPSRARMTWMGSVHGSPLQTNKAQSTKNMEPTSLQAMHKKAKRIQKLGDFE